MWPTTDLVDEAPGDADALLDVSDDAVARLEARVVVQRRPDLRAHPLQRNEDSGTSNCLKTKNST